VFLLVMSMKRWILSRLSTAGGLGAHCFCWKWRGFFLLQRNPLLSVVLVVIPALLLLWEENGYVNWSRLFSFTRCQNLVLKKIPKREDEDKDKDESGGKED